jgi:hypothetical protein
MEGRIARPISLGDYVGRRRTWQFKPARIQDGLYGERVNPIVIEREITDWIDKSAQGNPERAYEG